MPTRGVKRKYPEWEESVLDGSLSFEAESYLFFRQSLLNISLEKYNKGRSMAEPSLRRYVLVANTLRIIQNEIHYESPCHSPAEYGGSPATCELSAEDGGCSSLPPDLENILVTPVGDDITLSAAVSSILSELESVLEESSPQRFQCPVATAGPETEVESVSQVCSDIPIPQLPDTSVEATREEGFDNNSASMEDSQDMELIRELVLAAACSEDLSAPVPKSEAELPVAMDTSVVAPVPVEAPLPSNVHSPADSVTSSGERMETEASSENTASSVPVTNLRSSQSIFGSFEVLNASYLNDVSFDDRFSDIDTSVFEREALSLGCSNQRLSASDDYRFPSSCCSPTYSSGQGVRELGDLDNIFEILVGS
ncbi:SERTA domain-containing protein 2-like [Hyperolius riggenbachi]|uniref:SERTA domain-containing protein 2-like n=1 Tax=Hyperolius riggenbachi TaxID=752182 RepID=UPI0035A37D29